MSRLSRLSIIPPVPRVATGAYGNLSYAWDKNGNRTSYADGKTTPAISNNRLTKGNLDYRYGADNRLSGVYDSAGTQIAGYLHNTKGLRVEKNTNGTKTLYIYDMQGNLVSEIDAATGTVQKEYAYGPEGRLATFDTGGAVYWHHNDQVSAPVRMTDSSGAVAWSMTASPFGMATVNEDVAGTGRKVVNNFRFPGQYFDAETGLNDNWHRAYDPASGRYTQHDPIGLLGGMNPYAYVGGNPVGFIDPSGLVRWGDAGGAVVGLVSNFLGVAVGGSLMIAPDVTMLTKVVGGAVLAKSTTGVALNANNLWQAIIEGNVVTQSSAARLVANVVAPCSKNAEKYADVADLLLDFASGRPRELPYGGMSTFTQTFDPAARTLSDQFAGSTKLFQTLQSGQNLYEDAIK